MTPRVRSYFETIAEYKTAIAKQDKLRTASIVYVMLLGLFIGAPGWSYAPLPVVMMLQAWAAYMFARTSALLADVSHERGIVAARIAYLKARVQIGNWPSTPEYNKLVPSYTRGAFYW